MLRARRLASTTVGALAILGCAGDGVVAPRFVPPTSAQLVEQSVTPHHEAVDTVASPRTSVGAQALAPTSAHSLPSSCCRQRIAPYETERYSREQTLGFERDVASESCLVEGTSTGQWQLRYSGYGCVALTADDAGTSLTMAPAVAEGADETHAPLLLGPEFGDRMIFNTRVEPYSSCGKTVNRTPGKLRGFVWQYQDDNHFYYFIPKPNGWELGKRDPSYPGGQRFLATSTDQKFPVGKAYNVQVTHRGNVFAVVVDGTPVVSFTDTERPYLSGRIALYSEDASIKVHQVSVRSGL